MPAAIPEYERYYFITFTCNPNIYDMSPKEQYDLTKPMVLHILRGYDHTTVAEVTDQYNIHYHSIVYIKNDSRRYTLFKQIYGTINSKNRYLGKKFHYFSFDSAESVLRKVIYIQKGKDDAIKYEYIHVLQDNFDIFNIFVKDKLTILFST